MGDVPGFEFMGAYGSVHPDKESADRSMDEMEKKQKQMRKNTEVQKLALALAEAEARVYEISRAAYNSYRVSVSDSDRMSPKDEAKLIIAKLWRDKCKTDFEKATKGLTAQQIKAELLDD